MQVWVELDHCSAFKHSTGYKLFVFSLPLQQYLVICMFFKAERNGHVHHFGWITLFVAQDSVLKPCCPLTHHYFIIKAYWSCNIKESRLIFFNRKAKDILPCSGSRYRCTSYLLDQDPSFSVYFTKIETDKFSELVCQREAGKNPEIKLGTE